MLIRLPLMSFWVLAGPFPWPFKVRGNERSKNPFNNICISQLLEFFMVQYVNPVAIIWIECYLRDSCEQQKHLARHCLAALHLLLQYYGTPCLLY